jgi:type IV pilus assembly protein PilV
MRGKLPMRRRSCGRACGFSLVEVLVGLMVISVGLLGVARVQALALSSTGKARTRSMVAFAASSLAATMSADRKYWAAVQADPAVSVTVTSATVSASDPDLQSPPSGGCTASSPCTAAGQLAMQDLHDWAVSLQTLLPANTSPTATVTCQIVEGNPVTCAINIAWTENLVSTTYSSNTTSSAQQNLQAVQKAEQTSYTLYTEP